MSADRAEPTGRPDRSGRQVLTVGASGDAGAVFAALSAAYTVHAEPASTLRWTWLDTADWRLHRAGVALREERRGRGRDLVLDRPGRPAEAASCLGIRWPARLDRVSPSPVRDAIAPTVGVRALLPVAEVETRHVLLHLRDDAGKTRVRVSVDQQRLLSPRRAALPLHVVVRPLRGYDGDARRCVELLADAMGAEPTELSATAAALAAAGHLPDTVLGGGIDAAPAALEPTAPAVRVVAAALLADVAVVDGTREGAIADHDTEFLHDLRSAVRATRALLAVAGHLLHGRSAVRVERDLAWLEEMTAPLRAVDIALLGLAEGSGDTAIDGLAADAIEPLREELRRRRQRELRRMRATLRASRAPAAFTAWRRDLTTMLDADVIGPAAIEAATALADAAFDALAGASPAVGEGGSDGLAPAVASLRAVLAAFVPLYRSPVEQLRRDLDELYETLRRREGVRITHMHVHDAAHAGAMPVPAVLAAGAIVDRLRREEAALDERVRDAHRDAVRPRSRRRLATEVTSR
ncbi:CHAD domain-containing protein [Jatrophihabitans endophyticus]|nr:CHAD domain-containing protein [Jatrophihabitans endophyticus]